MPIMYFFILIYPPLCPNHWVATHILRISMCGSVPLAIPFVPVKPCLILLLSRRTQGGLLSPSTGQDSLSLELELEFGNRLSRPGAELLRCGSERIASHEV